MTPGGVKTAFGADVARPVVDPHPGGHLDRVLADTFANDIAEFQLRAGVERRGQVTVVDIAAAADQHAAHGLFSVSVTEKIGQGRVDRRACVVVPAGAKQHVAVKSFERGSAVDLESRDAAAFLCLGYYV